MNNGFIKVAAATPDILVADCDYNTNSIIGIMKSASEDGVKLLCLPELCVTGYTCGDLFLQKTLIDKAFSCVKRIAEESNGMKMSTVIGAPIFCNGKLFNCAVVIFDGKILGIVPKTNLPNYNEFYRNNFV